MRLNEIATEIHRRMCEDDRFGYSWEERYGAIWETWTIGGDAGSSGGSGSGENLPAELPFPRFRVAIKKDGKKHWLPWMLGLVDEGGSSDTYAGIEGCGIVDIEFEGGSLGPDGWFSKNMKGDKLIGLTVFYDTPDPDATGYYQAMYRCHWMGKNPAWGKYEYDDDDGGAGNDCDQLDMVELTIVRCCLL